MIVRLIALKVYFNFLCCKVMLKLEFDGLVQSETSTKQEGGSQDSATHRFGFEPSADTVSLNLTPQMISS